MIETSKTSASANNATDAMGRWFAKVLCSLILAGLVSAAAFPQSLPYPFQFGSEVEVFGNEFDPHADQLNALQQRHHSFNYAPSQFWLKVLDDPRMSTDYRFAVIRESQLGVFSTTNEVLQRTKAFTNEVNAIVIGPENQHTGVRSTHYHTSMPPIRDERLAAKIVDWVVAKSDVGIDAGRANKAWTPDQRQLAMDALMGRIPFDNAHNDIIQKLKNHNIGIRFGLYGKSGRVGIEFRSYKNQVADLKEFGERFGEVVNYDTYCQNGVPRPQFTVPDACIPLQIRIGDLASYCGDTQKVFEKYVRGKSFAP